MQDSCDLFWKQISKRERPQLHSFHGNIIWIRLIKLFGSDLVRDLLTGLAPTENEEDPIESWGGLPTEQLALQVVQSLSCEYRVV